MELFNTVLREHRCGDHCLRRAFSILSPTATSFDLVFCKHGIVVKKGIEAWTSRYKAARCVKEHVS